MAAAKLVIKQIQPSFRLILFVSKMHNKDDDFVQLLIVLKCICRKSIFKFNNKNGETFISHLYCVQ